MRITVPASLDEAKAELSGLGELLTATEWHRSAIVAGHVRLDLGHGGRETADSGRFVSARAFAALGLRGLRSKDTVAHYVQCWLDEHDGNYPARGKPVRLPLDIPWPPQARNAGSRATKASIGTKIAGDADLARAAAEAFAEGAVEQLDPETLRLLARAVDTKIVADSGPKPPKPGPPADDEVGPSYWAEVRRSLHFLLDVQVKIDLGIEPPADIAIMMQILVPRDDWDDAARDLIDSAS